MATVPNPQTIIDGDVVDADFWNTEVRDAINFLMNPPAASIYSGATQNYTSGSFNLINYDTVRYDSDNMWSPLQTDRLTINTPGLYQVIGACSWEGNTAGYRVLRLNVNGSEVLRTPVPGATVSNTGPAPTVVGLLTLVEGDYLTLEAYQNSGVSLGTSVSPGALNRLAARWLGST